MVNKKVHTHIKNDKRRNGKRWKKNKSPEERELERMAKAEAKRERKGEK